LNLSLFKLNNAFFDEIDLKTIENRLSKGVIHLGSPIIFSNLDMHRDSALMDKYIVYNEITKSR
jgi:hypothetical protein